MHPLMVEKIRVLGLVFLSFMLAAGFICILISASQNGNWITIVVAIFSVSIVLPGRIGHMLMKSRQNEEQQEYDSGQRKKIVMLPGLGTLCLLFAPMDDISDSRNKHTWLAIQIASLILMILALLLPFLLYTLRDDIKGETVALAVLGALLMMSSMFLYSHIYHKDEDDIYSLLEEESGEESEETGCEHPNKENRAASPAVAPSFLL